MKRLFFDIETSPNIGFFWEAGHEINVDSTFIIRERQVICICYKWAGENKTHSLQWNSKQDDKKMIVQFLEIMKEADEVIGHNGDNFDIKWLRTRCVFHRIPMPPEIVSIDTLKEAKKLFRLNSNRLDYIGQYLGVGRKVDTGGFDTWRKIVLDKDRKALARMIEYCKNDVILLEKVWDIFNPYVKPKTRVNDIGCAECGKCALVIHNTRKLASGRISVQVRCKSCGKYQSMPESRLKKLL